MNPDSSPPVVRRAAVTYGRRREAVSDADTSASSLMPDIVSRASSSSPAELPPDSDGLDLLNSSIMSEHDADASNADSDQESGVGFEFSWKKKLKNWNSDDEAEESMQMGKGGLSDNADNGQPDASKRAVLIPERVSSVNTVALQESGLDNQPDMRTRLPLTSISPTLSPVGRRRRTHKPVAYYSDGDGEGVPPLSVSHSAPTEYSPSRSRDGSAGLSPPSRRNKGKQRAIEEGDLSDVELRAAEGDTELQPPGRRRKPATKGKEKRTRAPTKKDREETQKATARLMAERTASVPRVQTKKLFISELFSKIEQNVKPVTVNIRDDHGIPMSDPIQPFSSSPAHSRDPSPERRVAAGFEPTGLLGLGTAGPSTESHDVVEQHNSDEDMPDVDVLLAKDAEERKRKRLKQLYLERQANVNAESDDESDLEIVQEDMRIVAKDEAHQRRIEVNLGIKRSAGKRNHLALAGRRRSSSIRTVANGQLEDPLQLLKAAATPSFTRTGKQQRGNAAPSLDEKGLSQILLMGAQQQAAQLNHAKEEEWRRRGGIIKERPSVEGQLGDALAAVVSKFNAKLENGDTEEDHNGEDDDEDDPDYEPDRTEHSQDEAEAEPQSPEEVAVFHDLAEGTEQTDEEDGNFVPRHHGGRSRRLLAAITSDDEDSNDQSSASHGRILAPDSSFAQSSGLAREHTLNHRLSVSSFGDITDNGTDKENDARMMYDMGEDKENTAVAVQPLFSREPLSRTGSLFGSTLGSPIPMESTPVEDRTPLRELSRAPDEDEDLFPSPNSQRAARRLAFGAPNGLLSPRSGGMPPPGADGSPQASKEAGGLQAGFADFFGSEEPQKRSPLAPRPLGGGGMSQYFTQETGGGGFDALRKGGASKDLSLTLDAGLQPAVELGQTLAKKADEIFEKEQGLLAEGFHPVSVKKSKVYINDYGFLTQHTPAAKLPTLTQLQSPTQGSMSSPLQDPHILRSASRRPLSALDSDAETDVTEGQSLRRLKKRRLSPTPSSPSGSPRASPSPSSNKSRTVLGAHRQQQLGAGLKLKPMVPPAPKLKKSVFIEGEAEESDDDAMMGFGVAKKDDEDELDDESQDQTLAELVDDKAMDEETLAALAVREKAREHEEADDEIALKHAQDVADGKHRVRRRDRGLNLSDDESSDEDEDAKARRKKLARKRNIDGDSLEQLANNPETLAFVEAYHADMADADDDFAHLQQDDMTLVDEESQRAEAEDQEDEEEEVITTTEFQRRVREAARQKPKEEFNPHDVSWMEGNEDDLNDGALPVKEVHTKSKPARPVQRQATDWDVNLEMKRTTAEDERDRARLQVWAKGESRIIGGGGARSTGNSAVTGGGKRRGPASVATRGAASAVKQANKLTKSASVLAAVSTSRRNKFQS